MQIVIICKSEPFSYIVIYDSANNLPFRCQISVHSCLQLITKLVYNLQNDIGEYCITMVTEWDQELFLLCLNC